MVDSHEAARDAGLRFVSDETPGLRRKRVGERFRYVDSTGKPVRDAEELARIKNLAIPPAWTDVWICPISRGHLQATGRDARGRKQYRYHATWRETRSAGNFDRMVAFGRALPKLRARVSRDMAKSGLSRERVVATVVCLLETTLIRVGNREYARDNGSFGLTTMRNRHVKVDGMALKFRFRGKGGKEHEVDARDRRLARIVRRCQELPGYQLFQYVDGDGLSQSVESTDVNDYLREITGADFTAKDFRTWAGTLLALEALTLLGGAASLAERKRNVVRAIEAAAQRLGNTVAICRKCYVHPAVIDAYMDGRRLTHSEGALLSLLRRAATTEAAAA